MTSHAIPASSRLDLHNSATDFDTARHGRCGYVHLASGRICRLPQRHRGPCQLLRRARAAARITVTDQAHRAMTRIQRRRGPQVVLITWPAGVTMLPATAFRASPYDVIIGHIAGSPVYVDVRQLAVFPAYRATLSSDEGDCPIGLRLHGHPSRPHRPGTASRASAAPEAARRRQGYPVTRHRTAIEQPPALTSVQEQMLRSVLAEQRAFRMEQLNGLAHQPTGGAEAAPEITAALQSAARFALTEIEEALARLGRGQHGKCIDCGKRISFERLEIIPMTARCAGCQRGRHESGTP